ncbi:hypothetical protein BYI23_A012350 [Burkholderia sp. YI23]|nr:hypothetical protein BYI23_A012350 [Burkholderia sp. YI23]
MQDPGGFRYLAARGAKGCTMSQELIILGAHPSRSTLYEELLHAMQYKMGLHEIAADLNGTITVNILMEVLAARILVVNERRWHIPVQERVENRRRLRTFSYILRKELGGVPWPLPLKLRVWTGFLARELESWMGRYLRDR